MKTRYWFIAAVVTAAVVAAMATPHLVKAYCPGGNSCGSGHAQT